MLQIKMIADGTISKVSWLHQLITGENNMRYSIDVINEYHVATQLSVLDIHLHLSLNLEDYLYYPTIVKMRPIF